MATIYVGRLDDFSTSVDGRTMVVATGAEDGIRTPTARTALRFIDLTNARVTRTISTRGDHLVGYSPDGRSLATLVDGTLRLLTLDGRHQQAPPVRVETSNPSGMAWRPDSKIIAIARGSNDGTVLVDPRSGQVTAPLLPPAKGTPASLEWTDDGDELIASNFDPAADPPVALRPSLWNLAPKALRSRMCTLGATTPPPGAWRRLVPVDVAPDPVCRRPAANPAVPARLPGEPVVAYRSRGQLWVADAVGHRQAVDAVAGDPFPPPGFVWSHDGAVAWAQNGRARELRQGHIRSRPCACSSVAFDGEVVEAVDADGHGRVRFTDAQGKLQQVTGLPTVQPTLLASHAGTAIVAGFTTSPERSTPSGLWAVRRSRAHRFAVAKTGALDHAPVVSPDDERVATSFGASGGACYTVDTVGVIDLRTLRVEYPTMPKAHNFSRLVRSLSWPASGALESVIAPVGCSATNAPTAREPAGTILKLRGGALAASGATGYDRIVGEGTVATILGPVRGGTTRGRLQLTAGHGTKLLASDADAVSVRP